MADKIKKFFSKKKSDMKFKMAGPGYKLADDTQSSSGVSASNTLSASSSMHKEQRQESEESRKLAEAALARINKMNNPNFNTSKGAIQAQVRKELEKEKQQEQVPCLENLDLVSMKFSNNVPNLVDPTNEDLDAHFVARNVYFRCPAVSEEVLSKDLWKPKIREYILNNFYSVDPTLAASLIIHSCNHNRGKIEKCVETLNKYLENIWNHPDEEKYHKIKLTNRVFLERVEPIDGAVDFLKSCSFAETKIANTENDTEEMFLVFQKDSIDEPLEEYLKHCLELLTTTEPMRLELDRNTQVLIASEAAKKIHLPDAFYALTLEEIKKEHITRMEELEKSQMLMTSAMREKESFRELTKKYKFAIVRIRMPDLIYLQGTFSVYEKYSDIELFLRANLIDEGMEFTLITPDQKKLDFERDGDKTLADLKLVPAAVLTFTSSTKDTKLLKEELLQRVNVLE